MARGPLSELRDALDKFESATGGDHRYRHVRASLRDVHAEVDRLPDHLDEPADDGEDRENGDSKSPRNFREARARSRDRLDAAERDDERKTSSASAASSPEGRRGGAAQEDS